MAAAGESAAAISINPNFSPRGAVSPWSGAVAPSPDMGSPVVGRKSDDSVAVVEGVDSDRGGEAKKPAWNKPSNGVVEVSPVMGAVSWPALGESTKASPKSSSSDSLSDPALPSLQIAGNHTSSPHKQVIPNSNPVAPTRQKSMKRGGGTSSGSVDGGSFSPRHQDPMGDIPPNTPPNTPGKAAAQSTPRNHSHKSHVGNERNSFKRGNGGPHLRGDGSYHHNYGGKRDQERGNQEWNPQNRSFGSRDAHMQPHKGFSSPFIRPAPFIAPPVPGTIRPTFVNPMGYSDMPHHPLIYVQGPPPPDALKAMPMVAPIPPHGIFFPVPDPQLHVPDLQLHAKIVSQIDYYFSNENLVKDLFLRKNMDDQGWVPIKLIAGFNKVSSLTENITVIVEALRTSTVVEVQGDKIRRRNDWMRWLMPLPTNPPTPDMLATSLGSVALESGSC